MKSMRRPSTRTLVAKWPRASRGIATVVPEELAGAGLSAVSVAVEGTAAGARPVRSAKRAPTTASASTIPAKTMI